MLLALASRPFRIRGFPLVSVLRWHHSSYLDHIMSAQPNKRQRVISTATGGASDMVNITDFDGIVGELKTYDEQRETVR